jgi:CLIP-associating protein 1/2
MDNFLPQLSSSDTRVKLNLGTEIIRYLQDEDNSLECSDIGHIIDGLVPWLGSSQFKVLIALVNNYKHKIKCCFFYFRWL